MTDDSLKQRFHEDGYVILSGIIAPQLIGQIKEEMNKLVDRHAAKLLAAHRIGDPLLDLPFETRLYHLYKDCIDEAPKSFRTELHLAGLFHLFFHPDLLDIVERFLGNEIRLYPNYTARPKFPEWEGTQVLWHQDAGYTETQKVDPAASTADLQMVNVWAPLVPVRPENGCMQFIPGTHKLGVVPHESKKHYLQIEQSYLEPHVQRAVDIAVDPGDIVLFNNLLFHQGQPNRSDTIRWSVDWRYQNAAQSTNRKDQGHIARSASNPAMAVQNAEEWAALDWK